MALELAALSCALVVLYRLSVRVDFAATYAQEPLERLGIRKAYFQVCAQEPKLASLGSSDLVAIEVYNRTRASLQSIFNTIDELTEEARSSQS